MSFALGSHFGLVPQRQAHTFVYRISFEASRLFFKGNKGDRHPFLRLPHQTRPFVGFSQKFCLPPRPFLLFFYISFHTRPKQKSRPRRLLSSLGAQRSAAEDVVITNGAMTKLGSAAAPCAVLRRQLLRVLKPGTGRLWFGGLHSPRFGRIWGLWVGGLVVKKG